MSSIVRSLSGVLDRKHTAPRIRKHTPPRITEHKPPKPADLPVGHQTASATEHKTDGRTSRSGSVPIGAALLTTGYMTKKGVVKNIFTGNQWKKRWFVLERGELTYYTDKSAWERGEKPLKGHRITVSTMRVKIAAQGADIVLERKHDGASEDDRIWQFICDSNSEIERWAAAFTAHGADLVE